jgi:hypothetical protein
MDLSKRKRTSNEESKKRFLESSEHFNGPLFCESLFSWRYRQEKIYISVVQHWATGWMIEGSSPSRGWEYFSSPPRLD